MIEDAQDGINVHKQSFRQTVCDKREGSQTRRQRQRPRRPRRPPSIKDEPTVEPLFHDSPFDSTFAPSEPTLDGASAFAPVS